MLARPQQPDFLPPPRIAAPGHALFIDFDGTLVPLMDRPDQVRADAELIDLLQALRVRCGPRLAIVSGRSIAQIDRMIGPIAQEIALAGSHGAELRYNGVSTSPPRPSGLAEASAELESYAVEHPGLLVETKSLGVALHYRMVPARAAEAAGIVRAIASRHGLLVQPGKMMMEMHGPGSDKGSAVAALLERPALAGAVPVVIGDDLTDEPALAVARAMGGIGIVVGGDRPSAARYTLADVGAVRGWLWQLVEMTA
ncbi:trehalose-phosphatase [Sphingomonas sp. YR710]|uniref:trehalose-phosphatase n=1 Tax=Sphingomonas sp. YR710 TaxID=1882773 RepID=UPI000B87A978|nr:trehalose-phosphatase [Sphingomonas sp. YR710]